MQNWRWHNSTVAAEKIVINLDDALVESSIQILRHFTFATTVIIVSVLLTFKGDSYKQPALFLHLQDQVNCTFAVCTLTLSFSQMSQFGIHIQKQIKTTLSARQSQSTRKHIVDILWQLYILLIGGISFHVYFHIVKMYALKLIPSDNNMYCCQCVSNRLFHVSNKTST